MKTKLALLASASLLGALAGTSGCVDNRASLEVQYVCSPPDSCDFTGGCAQFIGYVALDRGLNTTGVMDVYLQVVNHTPNNANLDLGRVNTNDAHVDEAVVKYAGLVGGETSFGMNNLVAAGGISAVKVPLYLGTSGAGEVVASIRLRGYYDDGTRFETGEFPVTVNVCASGCAANGSACTLGTCPPNRTGQTPLTCTK
jgi:hypothetical protein